MRSGKSAMAPSPKLAHQSFSGDFWRGGCRSKPLAASTRRLWKPSAQSLRAPLGPELTIGACATREWKGERHTVEATAQGLVYGGEVYASLSAVARRITGARWNGPRFFGLRREDGDD